MLGPSRRAASRTCRRRLLPRPLPPERDTVTRRANRQRARPERGAELRMEKSDRRRKRAAVARRGVRPKRAGHRQAISCGSYLCSSLKPKSALQVQRWINLATLLQGPAPRLRMKRTEYQSFALCLGVASLSRTWSKARRGLPAAILPSALARAQRRRLSPA